MRITQEERQIITEIIRAFDPHAEIRLFGSRVNDERKGGDIDLLVISYTLTYRDKLLIRGQLKDRLGERKIDLIVTKDLDSAFYRNAYKASLML